MRKYRDISYLILSVLFIWLYIPHLFFYLLVNRKRDVIIADMVEYKKRIRIELCNILALLFLLHNNRYFRTIFYFRAGVIFSFFFGWYRPGDSYFIISKTTKIGKGFHALHPYSTIINAVSVGDNFVCHHLVTIGSKNDIVSIRPKIGNNVCVGANSTIIGDITIGNNVIIGAGSVVVKNVPDNSVVAGNPARVIKSLNCRDELQENNS